MNKILEKYDVHWLSLKNSLISKSIEAAQIVTKCRWPRKISCCYCSSSSIGKIKGTERFSCNRSVCHRQFTVKTRTKLDGSKISLKNLYNAAVIVSLSEKMSVREFQTLSKLKSMKTCFKLIKIMRPVLLKLQQGEDFKYNLKMGFYEENGKLILKNLLKERGLVLFNKRIKN